MAALSEQLNRFGTPTGQWQQVGNQARQAVTSHLTSRPRACQTAAPDDVLPNYVAVRELTALGYRCAALPELERAARTKIRGLANSSDSWSAPEAILLAQVADAGQGDERQDAKDIKAVKERAQGVLMDLLASDGSYYRGMPAPLTELSLASATLSGWSGQPSGARLSPSTAQAMADIALLRGRIPDQPEENSAIDGYLAAVASSQLTGTPVGLGARPRKPATNSSARDHVHFYLDASLRTGEPLSSEDVRRNVGAFLTGVKNPLDRLTVTAAATFALLRTDQSCAVVDQETPQLQMALTQVVEQFASDSDAVRTWLTLLWSSTTECGTFQQQTASIAADFLKLLSVTPKAASPTAQAVAAWGALELTCAKNGSVSPVDPVTLTAFAEDSDPGDGLGLGVYAALRTEEMAVAPCSRSLRDKLNGVGE